MIDYEFKSRVLNSGIVEVVNALSYASYYYYLTEEERANMRPPLFSEEETFEKTSILRNEYPQEYHEAENICRATYLRQKRLRNRIASYLDKGHCLFLTLTFRDDVLASTNEETRKKYVKRFLKPYGAYVANVDYGEKKGREHYHAVVLSDSVDCSEWFEQCGAIDIEHIRVDGKSPVRLGKYIAKLTNHAIKETNRRCTVIFSRGGLANGGPGGVTFVTPGSVATDTAECI